MNQFERTAHAAIKREQPACVGLDFRDVFQHTPRVLSHIRESLLVVRGDTGYCGVIREPTWILIWDSPEAAEWHGGHPVMINARTSKVLDCRS
jgi:hypothetical protein